MSGWERETARVRGRGRVSRGMVEGSGFRMKQWSIAGEVAVRRVGLFGVREGKGVRAPVGMSRESVGWWRVEGKVARVPVIVGAALTVQ